MISPTGTGYVNYVAVETAEYLSRALGQRPADRPPRVVLFGESLGAWTSQDAFAHRGPRACWTPASTGPSGSAPPT